MRKGPKPRPVLERLAEQSEWQGDCLVWTGGCDPKGYARLNVEGRSRLGHRLSWIHHFGEPPPEIPCVLHRCDNPPCWNPEHLFLGTKRDNNDDKMRKGRHVPKPRLVYCQRDHLFDEANTYTTPDGRRQCRKCMKFREERRRG